MRAPGQSRPDRLRHCVDQIRQVADWLEAEGFAWAPAELGGIADEIRDHIGVIEPREGMVKT